MNVVFGATPVGPGQPDPGAAGWCATTPPPPVPARDPRDRGVTFSSLCSLGWQRLMITGLCRDILTRHFAVPLHIESPDLRRYVWSADERTGILIESIYRWRGTLVEKRPAVVIKPNAMQNVRFGIGDQLGTDGRGMRQYSTGWVGSHTLFCLHGSGAGAEILAAEVQREMTEYGPVLQEYLQLLRWLVTEVGAVAELEEAKESFAVPITVAWCYMESWMLELESPKLRKVPFSALVDGAVTNQTS